MGHLDELVVTIGGRKHWLWRAGKQDGYDVDEDRSGPPQDQGRKVSDDATDEEAGISAGASSPTSFGSTVPAFQHDLRR